MTCGTMIAEAPASSDFLIRFESRHATRTRGAQPCWRASTGIVPMLSGLIGKCSVSIHRKSIPVAMASWQANGSSTQTDAPHTASPAASFVFSGLMESMSMPSGEHGRARPGNMPVSGCELVVDVLFPKKREYSTLRVIESNATDSR